MGAWVAKVGVLDTYLVLEEVTNLPPAEMQALPKGAPLWQIASSHPLAAGGCGLQDTKKKLFRKKFAFHILNLEPSPNSQLSNNPTHPMISVRPTQHVNSNPVPPNTACYITKDSGSANKETVTPKARSDSKRTLWVRKHCSPSTAAAPSLRSHLPRHQRSSRALTRSKGKPAAG